MADEHFIVGLHELYTLYTYYRTQCEANRNYRIMKRVTPSTPARGSVTTIECTWKCCLDKKDPLESGALSNIENVFTCTRMLWKQQQAS